MCMAINAVVYSATGEKKGSMELPEELFGEEGINEALLHQVLTQYRANMRQGTAKTKGRGEVRGGGSKPWRQKGTGRARAGSNASPLWVRGGKSFGPAPRDYRSTIPAKMRRAALKQALSARAREERVAVVDKVVCEEPKTSVVAGLLKAMGLDAGRKLLIVAGGKDSPLVRSARNIRDVRICSVSDINAWEVITSEHVIFADPDLVGGLNKAVHRE